MRAWNPFSPGQAADRCHSPVGAERSAPKAGGLLSFRGRVSGVLVAVIGAAAFAVGVVSPAYANYHTGKGFAIPYADGSSGSWIGSYVVDGQQVYCGDPDKSGPATSGGYGPPHVVRTWTDITGSKVSDRDIKRASYVLSKYGRTSSDERAAAVDTVVYALLGRGAFAWGGKRSEQRMKSTGRYEAIKKQAKAMLVESTKFAGEVLLSVKASQRDYDSDVKVSVRVKTEYGTALTRLPLAVEVSTGVKAPTEVRTNSKGKVTFKVPSTPGQATKVTVTASDQPDLYPTIRTPNDPVAQRMMIVGQRTVYAQADSVSAKTAPVTVDTVASPSLGTPGVEVVDKVTLTASTGYDAEVTSTLYGPFPTHPAKGDCVEGLKVGEFTRRVRLTSKHDGVRTYTTDPVGPLNAVGFYTWITTAPATETHDRLRTRCGIAAETVLVEKTTPIVNTYTSKQRTKVLTEIHDNVNLTGLPEGEELTVTAHLYGPARREANIDCTQAPAATVTYTVTGDGDYQTPPVAVAEPGWYGWVQVLPETDSTKPVTTECVIPSETTRFEKWEPTITTVTSEQKTHVGTEFYDLVRLRGVPDGFTGTVIAYLYGPTEKEGQLKCTKGQQIARVKFDVNGPGDYKTPLVSVPHSGWYSWTEELRASDVTKAVSTKCALKPETAFVTRQTTPPVRIETGGFNNTPTPTVDEPGSREAWLPGGSWSPLLAFSIGLFGAAAVVVAGRRLTGTK